MLGKHSKNILSHQMIWWNFLPYSLTNNQVTILPFKYNYNFLILQPLNSGHHYFKLDTRI